MQPITPSGSRTVIGHAALARGGELHGDHLAVQLAGLVRRGHQRRQASLRLHARLFGRLAGFGADELGVLGDVAPDEFARSAAAGRRGRNCPSRAWPANPLRAAATAFSTDASVGARYLAHGRAVVGQPHHLVVRGVDPFAADIVSIGYLIPSMWSCRYLLLCELLCDLLCDRTAGKVNPRIGDHRHAGGRSRPPAADSAEPPRVRRERPG